MSANAIRAGKAFVEIGAQDKYSAALNRAAEKMKAFGNGVRNVGAILGGAGAAIGAPILASAKTFATAGDQVQKMAIRTGIAASTLSTLGFAAEQSGTDLGTLESGLRRMQKTIGEAAQGSVSAQTAIENLGVSASQLAGLSPDEQFSLIADSISQIEDPAKRATAAMQIFGKQGAMLLPMLTSGSGGIKALQAEARALGIEISDLDANNAAELGDAFNRFGRTMKAIPIVIGAAVAPALTNLMTIFANGLTHVLSWIKEHQKIVVVAGAVSAVLVTLGGALIAVGTSISLAGFAMGGLSKLVGTTVTVISALKSALGALILVTNAAGTQMISLAATSMRSLIAATVATTSKIYATVTAMAALRVSTLATGAAALATSAKITTLGFASQALSGIRNFSPAVAIGGLKSLGTTAVTAGIALKGALVTMATGGAVALAPLLLVVAKAALVIGAVTAIGAVFVIAAKRAGLFAGAWESVKSTLTNLLGIVKKTFGGIATALSAGEYMQAVQILWAGIKATFFNGLASIKDSLTYMYDNAISGTVAFGKSLLSTLYDAFKAIPGVLWSAIKSGGSLLSMIAKVITGDVKGLLNGIDKMAEDSSKNLDNVLDKSKQSIDQKKDTKNQADSASQQAAMPNTSGIADDDDQPEERDDPKEQHKKALESIKSRTDAMQQETLEMQHGQTQAERMKLAQMAAADSTGELAAALAAYDQAAADRAAAEVDASVRDRVKSLQEEAYALRHGEEAAERYRLKLMGATAEQLRALQIAQQQAAEAKKQSDLQAAGKTLTDAMKTPLENFRDEMARIKELESGGAIDGETGRRARAKAKESFAGEADTAEKRQKMFRDEQARIQQLVAQGRLSVEAAQGQMSAISALLQEAKNRAGAAGEQMKQIATSGTFDGFSLMRGAGNQGDTQKKILTVNERQLEENKLMRRAFERQRPATFQ